MPLAQERKQELISSYQVHETDTGSPEVQVAMLSGRITQLTDHLRTHPKDFASRRGLLKLIGRRKQLLAYLSKHENDRYRGIVERLGLRR